MSLRRWIKCALVAAASSAPLSAQADVAGMTKGLDACLYGFPDFNRIHTSSDGLPERLGWDVYPGMSDAEFQVNMGDTNVFVDTTPGAGGCSVMDETVSQTQALKILENGLNHYFSGEWHLESGYNGTPVRRVRIPNMQVLEIYVTDDLSGNGAGIGMGIQQ